MKRASRILPTAFTATTFTASGGKPDEWALAEYDALSGLEPEALPGAGRPGGRQARLRPQSAGCGVLCHRRGLKDYLIQGEERRLCQIFFSCPAEEGSAGSKQFIAGRVL